MLSEYLSFRRRPAEVTVLLLYRCFVLVLVNFDHLNVLQRYQVGPVKVCASTSGEDMQLPPASFVTYSIEPAEVLVCGRSDRLSVCI